MGISLTGLTGLEFAIWQMAVRVNHSFTVVIVCKKFIISSNERRRSPKWHRVEVVVAEAIFIYVALSMKPMANGRILECFAASTLLSVVSALFRVALYTSSSRHVYALLYGATALSKKKRECHSLVLVITGVWAHITGRHSTTLTRGIP